MYYKTRQTNDSLLSQYQVYLKLIDRFNCSSKYKCLVGYKDGYFKSDLCCKLGCLAVNKEFFDCPKYYILVEDFKVNSVFCCERFHGLVKKKKRKSV